MTSSQCIAALQAVVAEQVGGKVVGAEPKVLVGEVLIAVTPQQREAVILNGARVGAGQLHDAGDIGAAVAIGGPVLTVLRRVGVTEGRRVATERRSPLGPAEQRHTQVARGTERDGAMQADIPVLALAIVLVDDAERIGVKVRAAFLPHPRVIRHSIGRVANQRLAPGIIVVGAEEGVLHAGQEVYFACPTWTRAVVRRSSERRKIPCRFSWLSDAV